MASEIPIPKDTARAAHFVAHSDPHLVGDFWDSQLADLAELVQSAETHQTRRGDHIDPTIRPDAGKVKAVTPLLVSQFCGLGAARWMG